ncbi:hypothetical protein OAK06_08265 [Gammaproteobacteria bacterium]|nr:hypothetical protein [Gammaproteobacteria bacterium]
MVFRKFINKFKNDKLINVNRFQEISRKCIDEPSKTYEILYSEFNKEMRKIAVKQINKEKKFELKKLSKENKTHLVAEREKELWGKVRSGGLAAFALITGISIG